MYMKTLPQTRGEWRDLRGVAVFTVACILVSSIAALGTRNSEFLFYIVVMFVLATLVAVAHRCVGFSKPLLWALGVWGGLHMAGGLVPVPASWPINGDIRVLYSWWLIPGKLKYDHVVHAYGFGITTWACWQGLKSSLSAQGVIPLPTFGRLVLCVAAGMGFGAMNEVVEFAATLGLPETNVGGYLNTGWDLVANMVGCIAVAVTIRLAGPSPATSVE